MTDEASTGSLAHMIGRLDAKVDRIADRIEVHGEKIAKLEVRVDRHDEDLTEVRATEKVDQQHGITGRQMIAAAVVTVLGGGLMTLVITLLTAHHI